MSSNGDQDMNRKCSLVVISQWGKDLNGVNVGNVKKLLLQIKAFEQEGFDVKSVIKEPPKRTGSARPIDRLTSKAKNILPFGTNQCIIRYKEVGPADCYYIRFRAYDFYFRKLVKNIRKNNPNAKIIMEYSDYPYITFRGTDKIGDALVKFRDDYNRKRTLKYVDCISTPLLKEELDGKKCLKILNGVDVEAFPEKKQNKKPGELNVLIVASLQPAHGVDRFIRGMKEYYKNEVKEKVILHVVGGGSILPDLQKEAADLGDKVVFHGFKFGKELDELYDQCDIGLEILAPKRKDIKISAALKTREYICRVFPFVSACTLDISELGYNEYCRVSDDEGPIDINQIIEYYFAYEKDYESKRAYMRQFARRFLDMRYAMKDVTEYFRDSGVYQKED